jgi:hypothetical protein
VNTFSLRNLLGSDQELPVSAGPVTLPKHLHHPGIIMLHCKKRKAIFPSLAGDGKITYLFLQCKKRLSWFWLLRNLYNYMDRQARTRDTALVKRREMTGNPITRTYTLSSFKLCPHKHVRSEVELIKIILAKVLDQGVVRMERKTGLQTDNF